MNTVLLIVLTGCLGFLVWRMLKGNRGAFSAESIGRSFFTLGILALLLILVVVVCVKILKM